MSRQELADAINVHLHAAGVRLAATANYVGRLERGDHRWPGAAYRRAFRAVLGAATDAELGFYITRRAAGDHTGPDEHGLALVAGVDSDSVKVPADFWDRPDVLDMLRRRDLGALFRLLRQHYGVDERWMASTVGLPVASVVDLLHGTDAAEALSTVERMADGLVMPDHAWVALGLAPSLPGTSLRRGQVMSLRVEVGASVTVVALGHPALVTVAAPLVQVGDRPTSPTTTSSDGDAGSQHRHGGRR